MVAEHESLPTSPDQSICQARPDRRPRLHPVATPQGVLTQVRAVGLCVAILLLPPRMTFADDRELFFEQHIRPVLVERCYECHSSAEEQTESGLALDSSAALRQGGESGVIVVPGMPAQSLLIEALKYEGLEMPPDEQLDARTIRHFEEWIRSGAFDPREDTHIVAPAKSEKFEDARSYWSFRPAARPQAPAVNAHWGTNAMDAFVLRQLEKRDLKPAARASRTSWLRRVTYDLIGLPPTLEELDAFVDSNDPLACERVVERLLSSPHYGERWGRHWLDLARYADSNGADENHKYPVAWRYRDYVISAFNADKPFDRMTHEQLAGDLLVAKSEEERRENLTATGFLVLGPKMLAEQDKEKLVADIVDEQIDTVGKVFLGLTLGCARCHDHKFDPILAEDYYSLAGVFHSTKTMEHLDHVSQWNERALPDAEREQQIAEEQSQLEQAEAELDNITETLRDVEFEGKLAALRTLMLAEQRAGSKTGEAESNLKDSTKKWLRELEEILKSDSGIFRVWHQFADLEPQQFPIQANMIWEGLEQKQSDAVQVEEDSDAASEDATSQFDRRLTNQPVPTNRAELVTSYLSALRDLREQGAEVASELRSSLFVKQAVFDQESDPTHFLTAQQRARFEAASKRLDELVAAKSALDMVMAADEADVKLVSLHVRGSHLRMSGQPLERRVLRILEDQCDAPDFPADRSGRLEFARWLTDAEHPLTARVMVNRIWQGHFGQGLVRTPSNFGMRGEEPTHPELLDWLAAEFIRSGWSIKHMHRLIVLSETYRMSCDVSDVTKSVDPDNFYLSHFPRRRLELEPIRDSLLAVAGELDRQLYGEVAMREGEKYVESGIEKTAVDSPRRTLYLPVNRAALEPVFAMFDYIDPAVTLEQRPTTIVPHQTLFMMNHPLVLHAGQALAERLIQATSKRKERLRLVYKILFARLPTDKEIEIANHFLPQNTAGGRSAFEPTSERAAWQGLCRALLMTSEFIYVD